jgi:preprotein translocase subunit SecA
MLNNILRFIFGSQNEREVKALRLIADQVNSFSDAMKSLSDVDLKYKTVVFRERLAKGETLDDILPEAFAAVREAAWRILGERPFDVQVMGGTVLHRGKIAEMRTGEGKTLTSTMPIYLNALSGLGVHVVTVNDYLARRDRNWMGPVFEFMGLEVGVIQHDMPFEEKRTAYGMDITYGTNNEFGFDYLRDNMAPAPDWQMQRPHNYAIVDEVDSVLIDEARTPLIISGPAEESTEKYYSINKIIPFLNKDEHFALDEKAHTIVLTEAGNRKVEELLKIDNLYNDQNVGLVHHVNQALRAHHLYKKDVEYIVKDNEVIIVDEFTGRLMPGRRFSEGLHQALEAKEGVRIANENQTLATITFQNYFRLYKKLAGMTGTADTEAVEFHEIYKLPVVVMPTNRPMIRADLSDRIYRTEHEKFNAIVEEIARIHAKGQPVLVGTISIENSEKISRLLQKRNVIHNVLNAKYHEKEASIIREAGRPGMVTIATNMAGRGTDIILGGYPEYKDDLVFRTDIDTPEFIRFLQSIIQNDFSAAEIFLPSFSDDHREEALVLLAKKALQNYDFARCEEYLKRLTLRSTREKIDKMFLGAKEWKKNHDLVLDAGGLYVLGTERHESRRIDNQLRGRSGRQGDPGASCFFISLEDELMRLFGSERLSGVMLKLGMKEGEDIQHPWVNRTIENAQKKVENRNFEIRKHLLQYDNVMNDQRTFIYSKRQQILKGENLRGDIEDVIWDSLENEFDRFAAADSRNATEPFVRFVEESFGIAVDPSLLVGRDSKQDIVQTVFDQIGKLYDGKESLLGAERMRMLERHVFLHVLDTHWKDHLYGMDALKEGIGLRGYGQKDPLTEYKFEGFKSFKLMLESVKKEVMDLIIKTEMSTDREQVVIQPRRQTYNAQKSDFSYFSSARASAGAPDGGADPVPSGRPAPAQASQAVAEAKVGRNEPCPCGSGKKYKHCHGRNG